MRRHRRIALLFVALTLGSWFVAFAAARSSTTLLGSATSTATATLSATATPAHPIQDAAQALTTLPSVLRTDEGSYLWRSASALTNRSGSPLRSAPPLLLDVSPEQAAGEACIGQVFIKEPSRDVDTSWPTSLAEFVERASAVLFGSVVGVEGGILYEHQAGLMLEIVVADVVKSNPQFNAETIFVFYPAGEVHIGTRVVCRRSGQLPVAPRVGDSVLLGLRKPPVSRDPLVLDLLGTGVEILFRGDSETFIPKGLDAVPEFAEAQDFEVLVQRTRELARNPIRR